MFHSVSPKVLKRTNLTWLNRFRGSGTRSKWGVRLINWGYKFPNFRLKYLMQKCALGSTAPAVKNVILLVHDIFKPRLSHNIVKSPVFTSLYIRSFWWHLQFYLKFIQYSFTLKNVFKSLILGNLVRFETSLNRGPHYLKPHLLENPRSVLG